MVFKTIGNINSSLTFIGPCNANIFTEYNQQDETFHNLFISVRRSTCFMRFFRPSSGAQNCTYSVRCWSDKYLTLYVQFWAPDDGQKNCMKHVERLTEINKLWNPVSCWLYSANINSSVVIVQYANTCVVCVCVCVCVCRERILH